MSDADSLKHAFRHDSRAHRRAQRAEATRRKALSPVRILLALLLMPFAASALTVSIFIRTSDFPANDALRHLVALAGCPAAGAVGVAPARQGEPGYHQRYDLDGDGVSCGSALAGAPVAAGASIPSDAPVGPGHGRVRIEGGAKFVRP